MGLGPPERFRVLHHRDGVPMSAFSPGCLCCVTPDCSCCTTTPTTRTLDFGAGGLINGACTNCVDINGDIVVSETSACTMLFQTGVLPCLASVQAAISSGLGRCWWTVTIDFADLILQIVYESTHELSATFDCTAVPVTLTKTVEITSGQCSGSLPATITLDT